MSTLLAPPRIIAIDGNGLVLPGALLYFYETGTNTPKDTYADAGLSTPNENPVEADANGLFPSIYLASGDYKAIQKTAAGVTIYTADPVPGLGAADSLTSRGDLLTRDANGYKRLPIGAAGFVLTSNGVEPVWTAPTVPRLAIQGLTYANNGTDATNDIDIAVGGAMDATSARMMVLNLGLTKRSDAAWAVGNNQGALDDIGSAGDNDFYIWLIHRSDTSVTDVLFSLSATAPTMPTNYNYKRLIGWFKRASSAVVAFKTYETAGGGLEFLWSSPTLDVDLSTTLGTTRRTDALKLPLAFSTTASVNVTAYDASDDWGIYITCPDVADLAPRNRSTIGTPATPLATEGTPGTAGASRTWSMRVRTSAAGAIASRASFTAGTGTLDNFSIVTLGFEWSRR